MHRNNVDRDQRTEESQDETCNVPGIWCVAAQVPGIFLDMTYSINIDQEFAIVNGLTLTQVSTLAAFMTLPTWANTAYIGSFVWYKYSEERMAEDFPLLFGVAKRCYKNISELAALGFVELTKLGRDKYIRFTGRCAEWNRKKVQNRTERPESDEKSPKTDQISPKMDFLPINTKNITNSINTNIAADGGLFPDERVEVVATFNRTAEKAACLFVNSQFARYEDFAAQFTKPEFANADILYYYHAVADWSAQKGKKMKDWIATARNFMRRDIEQKKLHVVSHTGGVLSPDAEEYLTQMADGL